MSKTKMPIAILGAGIAGLTAADFLKRNNVPFVLYEAVSYTHLTLPTNREV